jgi:predicted dehydrogenase
LVEELDEFADCVRGKGKPEVDGDKALRSLAVIRAGVKSAREGRHVTIEEILAGRDE